MNIKKEILNAIQNDVSATDLEKIIKDNKYPKMKFSELEGILNTLFSMNKSPIVKLLNSYFSKLVDASPSQFFHLRVLEQHPKAYCIEMIQNYRFLFMYNRYMDCSRLLENWSPTESYFPLLLFIHNSNPDKPIDYTYWLKRFKELPTALKFLKQNSIPIEFTEEKDLRDLYKTIPQQYIQDFLDLLGTKSWYIDVIKETDHYLEEIEEWEDSSD